MIVLQLCPARLRASPPPRPSLTALLARPACPPRQILRREYSFRGLPLVVVRHITRQTLQALNFLHTTCGVIHTGAPGACCAGRRLRWRVHAVRAAEGMKNSATDSPSTLLGASLSHPLNTDLKPENVMLSKPIRARGFAFKEAQPRQEEVSPRAAWSGCHCGPHRCIAARGGCPPTWCWRLLPPLPPPVSTWTCRPWSPACWP